MKPYDWSTTKNDVLKIERGICFDDVVVAAHEGRILKVTDHPKQKKYPGQMIMIVEINNYAYVVPYVEDKEKILPYEKPINIALTVLAKSSAAFIVKYENILPALKWRILAIPYYVSNSDLNLDEILGHVKPLEIGFKFWVKKFSNGDRFVAYVMGKLYVFFCFALTPNKSNFKITNERLGADNSYYFESDRLIDLVGYDWGGNNFNN